MHILKQPVTSNFGIFFLVCGAINRTKINQFHFFQLEKFLHMGGIPHGTKRIILHTYVFAYHKHFVSREVQRKSEAVGS